MTERYLTGRQAAVLAGVAVLLANLLTLPLTLTEGDAAEWLVIARHGGIPHPSGYPLYAMLCRAAALLSPPLPLVTAVAILSAICAGLAAWLTCRSLTDLAFSSPVAVAATLGVFLSAPVWRVTNMPEPFALNLLLAAWILWLTARTVARGRPTPSELIGLGAAFGLGLCNHHSLVWLSPFGLLVLAASPAPVGANLARVAAGFLLGLLPLNYFWLARLESSPYDYYTVNNLTELFALILRTTYGTFSLAKTSTPANWGSVAHYFAHLPTWLSFGLLLPILAGLLTGWFRDPYAKSRAARWLPWTWALSFAGAGVLFLRLFNVPVEGWIPSVIERFMALPTWLLGLPLAAGLERGVQFLRAHSVRGVVGLLAALVLGHGLAQLGPACRTPETFYEDHVHTLFEITRVGGDLLITASDAETLGALHGRHVLGLGAQTFAWLNITHWPNRRFRERMAARFGLHPDSASLERTAFVAELLQKRGRAVVADLPRPPLPSVFAHSFVVGPAVVLVAPAEPLPTLDEMWSINRSLYVTAPLPHCAAAARLSAWDQALFAKYLAGLTELVRLFDAEGRHDLRDKAAALRAELDCFDK